MVEMALEKTTYTADDIYQLSLQGKHYELLNGRLLEMTPTKQTHGEVAGEFLRLIANFVRPKKLGAVYAAETGFALPNGNVLAADVSFTVKTRIQPEGKGFTTVVPDLVVEVVSPGNSDSEVQEKIEAYFSAGVRVVWVAYPRTRTIYAYTAPDKVQILKGEAILDGAEVLPGFTVKVSEIFSVLDH